MTETQTITSAEQGMKSVEQVVLSPTDQEVNNIRTRSESVLNEWTDILEFDIDLLMTSDKERELLPVWYNDLLLKYERKCRDNYNSSGVFRLNTFLEEQIKKKQLVEKERLFRPNDHMEKYVWSNDDYNEEKWKWTININSWKKPKYSKKELERLNAFDAEREWLPGDATYRQRLEHYNKKVRDFKALQISMIDVYEEKMDYDLLLAFIKDTKLYAYSLLEEILNYKDDENSWSLEKMETLFNTITSISWQMCFELMYEINKQADISMIRILDNKDKIEWINIGIFEQVARLNLEMIDFLENHYVDFNWYFWVKVEMISKQLSLDFSKYELK